MYEEKPWTLKKRRKNKSSYIKNREFDLAISTSKVQKLFERNKEKTYTNNEISDILGISVGTVSSITNRLEAVQDIKIVKVRQLRSALSQVFQHKSGSLFSVTKERNKEDAIVSIRSLFELNQNTIFVKDDLLRMLKISDGKTTKSLQILLLDGFIKLVGCTNRGHAQYQHKNGDAKEIRIRFKENDKYSSISSYLKKNNLRMKREEIIERLDSKGELFYSSNGLILEYPIKELEEVIKEINLKNVKKSIIDNIFKKK